MQLRLTLHFIPLFRREAPYASRLSAKSKHIVLAFCFQKLQSYFVCFGFTLKLVFRNYILQNSSEQQI